MGDSRRAARSTNVGSRLTRRPARRQSSMSFRFSVQLLVAATILLEPVLSVDSCMGKTIEQCGVHFVTALNQVKHNDANDNGGSLCVLVEQTDLQVKKLRGLQPQSRLNTHNLITDFHTPQGITHLAEHKDTPFYDPKRKGYVSATSRYSCMTCSNVAVQLKKDYAIRTASSENAKIQGVVMLKDESNWKDVGKYGVSPAPAKASPYKRYTFEEAYELLSNSGSEKHAESAAAGSDEHACKRMILGEKDCTGDYGQRIFFPAKDDGKTYDDRAADTGWTATGARRVAKLMTAVKSMKMKDAKLNYLALFHCDPAEMSPEERQGNKRTDGKDCDPKKGRGPGLYIHDERHKKKYIKLSFIDTDFRSDACECCKDWNRPGIVYKDGESFDEDLTEKDDDQKLVWAKKAVITKENFPIAFSVVDGSDPMEFEITEMCNCDETCKLEIDDCGVCVEKGGNCFINPETGEFPKPGEDPAGHSCQECGCAPLPDLPDLCPGSCE